jgi:hypothetical protein
MTAINANVWKRRAERAEDTIKLLTGDIKILGVMLTVVFLLYVFK